MLEATNITLRKFRKKECSIVIAIKVNLKGLKKATMNEVAVANSHSFLRGLTVSIGTSLYDRNCRNQKVYRTF